jgi:hypothetical protein
MVTGTIHFYLGATRIAQLIQTRGLITPRWILNIFVVLGSFSYAAAYTIGRLS